MAEKCMIFRISLLSETFHIPSPMMILVVEGLLLHGGRTDIDLERALLVIVAFPFSLPKIAQTPSPRCYRLSESLL